MIYFPGKDFTLNFNFALTLWPCLTPKLLGLHPSPSNCSKQLLWLQVWYRTWFNPIKWKNRFQFPVWMNSKQERTLKLFLSFQAKENANADGMKLASEGTECKTTSHNVGKVNSPALHLAKMTQNSLRRVKSLKDLGKQTSALQGSPESGRKERCGTQSLE